MAPLEKNSGSIGYRSTLFSTGEDAHRAKWDGARTSHEDVIRLFGFDYSEPLSALAPTLKALIPMCSKVYLDLPTGSNMMKRGKLSSAAVFKFLQGSRNEWESLVDALKSSKRSDLAPEVGKLRVIKSAVEQKVMKVAGDISGDAHAKVGGMNDMLSSYH